VEYKVEIVATGDGSDTLYVPFLDEHYHSVHGAIGESEHIFIRAGFHPFIGNDALTLLEVGFGTGLNVLLTALAADASQCFIRYYTLEKFPLSAEILRRINYPALLGSRAADLFRAIHESAWGMPLRISPMMELVKVREDFVTASLSEIPFCNLVYYDAFSPEKQPEMWNQMLFRKLFDRMEEGGIFVTYCAKGSVRRSLQWAGFRVERLPGPPGKREILRGIKPLCDQK
jgi:tRNA U34 5-methylaminomethyl-2-thiouridine-forming methyltransferase MnmC